MAVIVQKYGGTSVGALDRIANVARRVSARKDQGNDLVVVVSAMAGETDRLINLAKEITPIPNERETGHPGFHGRTGFHSLIGHYIGIHGI